MRKLALLIVAALGLALPVGAAAVGGGDPMSIHYAASSTLKPNGDITYGVENLFDGDIATAWVEGADGDGIGEMVFITFGRQMELGGLEIYAGYGKSGELYRKNNRVKTLRLYGDGELEYTIDLDDVQEMQLFELPEPVVAHEIGLMIYAVYPGTHYSDTCISEINFYVREPAD